MNEEIIPEIGMGVTQRLFSDSYPYTIIDIIDAKTILIQQDSAIRTDSNGMSDMQDYIYERNQHGPKMLLTKRRDGKWRPKNVRKSKYETVYHLGFRKKYYDFTF